MLYKIGETYRLRNCKLLNHTELVQLYCTKLDTDGTNQHLRKLSSSFLKTHQFLDIIRSRLFVYVNYMYGAHFRIEFDFIRAGEA